MLGCWCRRSTAGLPSVQAHPRSDRALGVRRRDHRAHPQAREVLRRVGGTLSPHADGFAARNLNQLDLRESEEMKLDREYLEQMCASLETTGLDAECLLAAGDPAKEISAAAARENCDLIAMSTHGHKFIRGYALRQWCRRQGPAHVARSRCCSYAASAAIKLHLQVRRNRRHDGESSTAGHRAGRRLSEGHLRARERGRHRRHD